MRFSPVAEPPIDIVGLHGGQWFGRDAEAALRAADVLIGHSRQLEALPDDLPGEPVELWGDLDEVLGFAAERRARGRRACILAAGDPGFFGLVRLAEARLGPGSLRVFPAPSSVTLAFARIGSNWDDATIVSAHGRPVEHAVEAVRALPKVAVLVSRDQPPELLGKALLEQHCGPRDVAVCSRLGEPDEQVTRTDLRGLAEGRFDPLSVVVLRSPGQPTGPGIVWGRSEETFAHRGGMITKAEVRAVALGKLAVPLAGVLWDVGAGSGSVAIECARLAPGLRVFAVEQRSDDVARLRDNVRAAGVGGTVTVTEGSAPEALAGLPEPDRAFIGGGGIGVLDAVLGRLRPEGVVVATYAVLATAAEAGERLGNLVQVQVSRGVAVGGGGALRLAAENPVFVCWGPS
jgi:precorrin-6B C5,15-methyltransferase / cobalt-precorrin-6B C5,C15-methyltransferase